MKLPPRPRPASTTVSLATGLLALAACGPKAGISETRMIRAARSRLPAAARLADAPGP